MARDNAYPQLYWGDLTDGDVIPEVILEIPYKRVVMTPGATWDFMPGHHEPDYARSQGQKTIYLNTMFFQSFVDRVVTDWAGPATFITRRKISMRASIFAGDTALGRGKVARVYEEQGKYKVDLELSISSRDQESSKERLSTTAEVTIILPERG